MMCLIFVQQAFGALRLSSVREDQTSPEDAAQSAVQRYREGLFGAEAVRGSLAGAGGAE